VIRAFLIIIFWAFLWVGCYVNSKEPKIKEEPLTIVLMSEQKQQEMHHFGASDCWSIQFVGKNWPEAKRNQIADLLFSTELKTDGSPVGIGLSCWRFNIGAGSAEQGTLSGIEDEWRRAPGFLENDGSFNWDNQGGQRWFLRAAKQRGVKDFIGFVNSPPVQMTNNGKAFSSGGSSANIDENKYVDYANFITEVISNIKMLDDIDFSYISPFNESQWDWSDGGQEGSPWLNSEMSDFVEVLSATFEGRGIQTHIDISESGQLNYLYENGDRTGRGDQVNAFFNSNSPNFIG
jgi:O-glycosyl hydrolase